MSELSPERIAAIWAALETLAGRIGDTETRARYLADWRERYDAAFPRWLNDGSIVRLPDWKHVGEISGQEWRRAKLVSDHWIEQACPDRFDAEAGKRFAWEMGRRARAGLIEKLPAEAVVAEKVGVTKGVLAAFARGYASEGGEALIAAIVLDLRCAVLPRTDKGNAERFRLRHGHDFRHTIAKGWLQWDGKRWKLLEEERGVLPAEILRAVFDTVAAIQREAHAVRATGLNLASIPEVDPEKFKVEVDGSKVALGHLAIDEDGLDMLVVTPSTCRLMSDALARFGRASEEARRIKCIPDLARAELTVRIQQFDKDPLTINCQNGTLRLIRHAGREGIEVEAVLSPHDRADLLTKVAAVAYDPLAVCPNYDFTIEWAQPKAAMRRYLHQWGGYNLTGDMGEQIFHVWWGPLAQNGKSTILDAWADCAGDYAVAGKIESFMEAAQARAGDAATPALAALVGARMVRTGEPPANAKFDESLINQITGQDALQLRDLNRSFFQVQLGIKVTVACNAPPTIPNATEGIKRRVKVVPFEKTMKGALKPDGTPLRDVKFKEKLVPEMAGIFLRLVEGALDWLRHGFVEPDDVTQWTEEYKDENDPLGRFLAYCTEKDGADRVQSSHLHALFVAWSKATGGPDWTQPYFTKKMKQKGFNNKASNGMQWLGLRMTRAVGDFVDSDGKVLDLSRGDAPAGGAVSARSLSPPADGTGDDGGAWDDPVFGPPDDEDDWPM